MLGTVHCMTKLCTGTIESTKSAPKASGVVKAEGKYGLKQKTRGLLLAHLVFGHVGACEPLFTMAAAMPSHMALGHSWACAVFHVPSAFFPMRHPVGSFECSTPLLTPAP